MGCDTMTANSLTQSWQDLHRLGPCTAHCLPWKAIVQASIQTRSPCLGPSRHLHPLQPEGEGSKTGKYQAPQKQKLGGTSVNLLSLFQERESSEKFDLKLAPP